MEAPDDVTGDHMCAAGRFSCLSERHDGTRTVKVKTCLEETWLCDGDPDCIDGSDEQNCAKCNRLLWQCERRPNTPLTCIKKDWVCNGSADCPDGSDERNCADNRNRAVQVEEPVVSTAKEGPRPIPTKEPAATVTTTGFTGSVTKGVTKGEEATSPGRRTKFAEVRTTQVLRTASKLDRAVAATTRLPITTRLPKNRHDGIGSDDRVSPGVSMGRTLTEPPHKDVFSLQLALVVFVTVLSFIILAAIITAIAYTINRCRTSSSKSTKGPISPKTERRIPTTTGRKFTPPRLNAQAETIASLSGLQNSSCDPSDEDHLYDDIENLTPRRGANQHYEDPHDPQLTPKAPPDVNIKSEYQAISNRPLPLYDGYSSYNAVKTESDDVPSEQPLNDGYISFNGVKTEGDGIPSEQPLNDDYVSCDGIKTEGNYVPFKHTGLHGRSVNRTTSSSYLEVELFGNDDIKQGHNHAHSDGMVEANIHDGYETPIRSDSGFGSDMGTIADAITIRPTVSLTNACETGQSPMNYEREGRHPNDKNSIHAPGKETTQTGEYDDCTFEDSQAFLRKEHSLDDYLHPRFY